MLTQILQLRRLNDELIDLGNDLELLVGLEVTSRKLLVNAIEDLDGARVLQLRWIIYRVVVDIVTTTANTINEDAGVGARSGPRGRRGLSERRLLLL